MDHSDFAKFPEFAAPHLSGELSLKERVEAIKTNVYVSLYLPPEQIPPSCYEQIALAGLLEVIPFAARTSELCRFALTTRPSCHPNVPPGVLSTCPLVQTALLPFSAAVVPHLASHLFTAKNCAAACRGGDPQVVKAWLARASQFASLDGHRYWDEQKAVRAICIAACPDLIMELPHELHEPELIVAAAAKGYLPTPVVPHPIEVLEAAVRARPGVLHSISRWQLHDHETMSRLVAANPRVACEMHASHPFARELCLRAIALQPELLTADALPIRADELAPEPSG